MKSALILLAALLALGACSGDSNLRERELDLKERELALQERSMDVRTLSNTTEAATEPGGTYTTADAVRDAEAKFRAYVPTIEKTNNAKVDLVESHTGDFTGDGADDVAIYFALALPTGGNALAGQGLSLYENTGSGVRVIAGFEPDYPFEFESVLQGRIWVNKLEWAPGDGHCCPSIKTPHGLTIKGGKVF